MTASTSSAVDYDAVFAYARDVLAPLAEKGLHGRVDPVLTRALGEGGILPALYPEGDRAQASARTICEIRERVAYHCVAAEVAVAMQGIGGYPILQSGQDHQRAEWLPRVRTGEAVAAFALTEPECGSDAAAVQLRAERTGRGWKLYGRKKWISNAPGAHFYTTFARTGDEPGSRGVTAFLVPADRPGLTATPLELINPHPIGTLDFDGVEVTEDDVLGEVNRGFRVAMQTFDLFRPSVGAAAIGMAQRALDMTVERVTTRRMFGVLLGEKQGAAHQLADAATALDAARLLVRRAADAYDSADPRVTAHSAMAKLYATETAQKVIDTAVQLHGAAALAATHPVGQLYTEIRATRIYEGASEVQRDLIARDLFRDTALGRRSSRAAR
ncbi:Acyl-CoA dehydrogenase [Pseudonocardia thermophila]|uniref:Acyl-CoA dehydrogenase n=1 Tax=Pseudonocardia thermophila TaxID=1848 RepID=A0A1M6WR20_PSETH|nr:acyl-CoA dehydrogenase family protein [Pseudonocardia thermophila]SHK96158.1 Acyl-CoA dehydrogenase [Pseudonocardia thermophila]